MTDQSQKSATGFPERLFDPQAYLNAMPLGAEDIGAMMQMPQYNVKAMTAAARALNRGLDSLVRQQSRMIRAMIDDSGKLAEAARTGEDNADVAARQTAVLRHSLDGMFGQVRDLVDTTAQVQIELLDAVRESLDSELEDTRSRLSAHASEESGGEASASASGSGGESRSGKAGGRSAKSGAAAKSEPVDAE
jgi:phasin family protein